MNTVLKPVVCHTNLMSDKKAPKHYSRIFFVRETIRTTHFLPCLAVTAISGLMAYFSGVRSGILLVMPAVLLGQFSVGWCNDYLDRHDDKMAKRMEKPIVSGVVRAQTIMLLSIAALIASLVLSYMYSLQAGLVHAAALTSAFLYNLNLKRTPFSIATYLFSFGLLPVFVAAGNPEYFVPAAWMIAASALLGAGVHFQNVLPDFKVDALAGVKGFPHYFSYNHALLLGSGFLAASAVCVTFGIWSRASTLSWIIIGLFSLSSLGFVVAYYIKNIEIAYKLALQTSFLCTLVMIAGALYMRV